MSTRTRLSSQRLLTNERVLNSEGMASGGVENLSMDSVPVGNSPNRPRPFPSHQVGHRLEIFEKKEDREKYACAYCNMILRDPMQARECGHRFCTPCQKAIVEEVKSKELFCEACKAEGDDESKLEPNNMFPDKGIKREMTNIRTKCPNDMCVWTGLFKEYAAHEKDCKHQPVQCEDCKMLVSKMKIDDHKRSECTRRVIKCDHCGTKNPFEQMKAHEKDCPKYPVPCSQCGKKDVPRDMMKKHKSRDCANRTVSCPIEGCSPPEQPQSQFKAHVQKDQVKHLTWLLSRIMELEEAVGPFLDSNSAGSSAGASMASHRRGSSDSVDLAQSVEVLKAKIEQLEEQLVRQSRQGGGGATGAIGGPSEGATGGAEASAMASGGGGDKLNAMEFKVNSLEPILSVLHGEMNRCIGAIEALEAKLNDETRVAHEFRTKIEQYERTISTMSTSTSQREAKIRELEARLNNLSQDKPDGTLLWRIPNFSQVRQDAVAGNMTNIHSRPFFTGPLGYKMCVRLYPNGDGMGKGTHLSLFFTLMRSPHDALLPWPFKQKVYFMLIDQAFKKHIVDAFRSEPNSSSFQRPTSEMNIATGCPLFMQLNKLSMPGHGYLKDDTMYIRVVVELDGIDDHLKQLDPRTIPLASASS